MKYETNIYSRKRFDDTLYKCPSCRCTTLYIAGWNRHFHCSHCGRMIRDSSYIFSSACYKALKNQIP